MSWTPSQLQAYETRRALSHSSEGDQELRRAAYAVNEADLHNDIFSECRRRGWIALHGSMAERTHRSAGEPDFTIIASPIYGHCPECDCTQRYSEGKCCINEAHEPRKLEPVPRIFFIECKSRTGKLSQSQQAMIHHAANLGTTIHVVRSFVEFLKVVDGPS